MVGLDETAFNVAADTALNHIADVVDEVRGDTHDVEIHAGILTIDLENGGQYVINKHGPNREIWLSSPVSGAAHFKMVDGRWQSTRKADVELLSLLGAELGVSL